MARIPCLGMGLPASHPAIKTHPDYLAGKFTPEVVGAEIRQMMQELAASPYECETFFISPEDTPDVLNDKLKEKEWKAVVIGWGVRAHPDLTEWFEALVNACHKYAPQAALCFNTSPITTLASLKRNVPTD